MFSRVCESPKGSLKVVSSRQPMSSPSDYPSMFCKSSMKLTTLLTKSCLLSRGLKVSSCSGSSMSANMLDRGKKRTWCIFWEFHLGFNSFPERTDRSSSFFLKSWRSKSFSIKFSYLPKVTRSTKSCCLERPYGDSELWFWRRLIFSLS